MTVTPYPLYENQKQLPENYRKEKIEEGHNTYVWQFQFPHDGYTTYHKVDFNGLTLDKVYREFPRFELVKVNLSQPFVNVNELTKKGEPIQLVHLWDYYSRCYSFLDLLAYSPSQKEWGLDFQQFSSIIAPKKTVIEIEKIIKEYNLTEFNDFIFFLIAKIQDVYIDEIEYYQKKEKQDEVNNFPDEINNLLRVIQKFHEVRWAGVQNKKPSQLEKITFSFNNEKPISITNWMLLLTIMSDIVRDEDGIIYSHERERILKLEESFRKLPTELYSPLKYKNQFKKDIVKTLHHFLKDTKKFNINNKIYIVIGRMLECALMIESEEEFKKTILPSANIYKVGIRSKITSYEKFLIQSIKDCLKQKQ